MVVVRTLLPLAHHAVIKIMVSLSLVSVSLMEPGRDPRGWIGGILLVATLAFIVLFGGWNLWHSNRVAKLARSEFDNGSSDDTSSSDDDDSTRDETRPLAKPALRNPPDGGEPVMVAPLVSVRALGQRGQTSPFFEHGPRLADSPAPGSAVDVAVGAAGGPAALDAVNNPMQLPSLDSDSAKLEALRSAPTE